MLVKRKEIYSKDDYCVLCMKHITRGGMRLLIQKALARKHNLSVRLYHLQIMNQIVGEMSSKLFIEYQEATKYERIDEFLKRMYLSKNSLKQSIFICSQTELARPKIYTTSDHRRLISKWNLKRKQLKQVRSIAKSQRKRFYKDNFRDRKLQYLKGYQNLLLPIRYQKRSFDDIQGDLSQSQIFQMSSIIENKQHSQSTAVYIEIIDELESNTTRKQVKECDIFTTSIKKLNTKPKPPTIGGISEKHRNKLTKGLRIPLEILIREESLFPVRSARKERDRELRNVLRLSEQCKNLKQARLESKIGDDHKSEKRNGDFIKEFKKKKKRLQYAKTARNLKSHHSISHLKEIAVSPNKLDGNFFSNMTKRLEQIKKRMDSKRIKDDKRVIKEGMTDTLNSITVRKLLNRKLSTQSQQSRIKTRLAKKGSVYFLVPDKSQRLLMHQNPFRVDSLKSHSSGLLNSLRLTIDPKMKEQFGNKLRESIPKFTGLKKRNQGFPTRTKRLEKSPQVNSKLTKDPIVYSEKKVSITISANNIERKTKLFVE